MHAFLFHVLLSSGLSGKSTSFGPGCSSTLCSSFSASVGFSCFASATAASICASSDGSPGSSVASCVCSSSSSTLTESGISGDERLPFSPSRLATLFSSEADARRVSRPRLWQYQKTKSRTASLVSIWLARLITSSYQMAMAGSAY